MMKKVICELCGKEAGKWVVFGHPFCDECAEKFKDYIQTTVDIVEHEKRNRKRPIIVVMDDISTFCSIKDGNVDIIRTAEEHKHGEVIDIHYNGFAYKDNVECKVIGCHKSASAGYIVELINL